MLIEHNGMQVIKGWPAKIEAAQSEKTYVINGASYERVAYGKEEYDWHADSGPCHDCAVVKGQLHVPGCDVERCPLCGGQSFGCDCDYDDD